MKNKSKAKMQLVTPRSLKAGAAADYIGVSRRYLHDLTVQGRLPVHKVGSRCYLYDIKDLDGFMDSCRVGATK